LTCFVRRGESGFQESPGALPRTALLDNGSTLGGSLSLRAEAREISRQNRNGKLDHRIPSVYRVSARGSGVIPCRARDCLNHAIRDSFPSYGADKSGISLALHDRQPSNASGQHGRECHRR
jgi:hypothetical protein